MATGIPDKSKCNSTSRNDGDLSFRLEYEGKSTVEEILNVSPAQLRCVASVEKTPKNQLIYGENLKVMRALLDNVELAGNVRLIYIDPPYATGYGFKSRQQNHAYHDTLDGAAYLEFLRQRLILLRELLAEDGSIYVHLDEHMAFLTKVLMDEIFGSKNFKNWITRKKCNPKNYTRNQYGNIADYILFYTKSEHYVWNQPFDAWTETTAKKEYQYIEKETGRRYKKVPIHAPGTRNGTTGQPWKGMLPPPGKHWQYPPKTLDEMDARGEIYWSPTGNPRRKVYLDCSKGIPVQDIWLDFKDAHNQNIKITGYPTEKNAEMLRRIVLASSNQGDIVLDAFSGSGTTIAIAEQLERRWVAIDNSPLAIETIVHRLAKGTEVMGDFVKSPKTQIQQESLLEINRVLRTGLDLYFEISPDLQQISENSIEQWNNELNFQANLW
jgi:adenine-specific DNA-methyltransferase